MFKIINPNPESCLEINEMCSMLKNLIKNSDNYFYILLSQAQTLSKLLSLTSYSSGSLHTGYHYFADKIKKEIANYFNNTIKNKTIKIDYKEIFISLSNNKIYIPIFKTNDKKRLYMQDLILLIA